ncbi:MAG: Glycosyl hydrolases family 15 [bacterium ADurb.Bin400]|nr:MAG: Glycosyl hydrolases family 15 [bacterium ADurb.Bin400]
MNNPFIEGDVSHEKLLAHDLQRLRSMRLPNGTIAASTKRSYDHIWIRDCGHVALCYLLTGRHIEATRVLKGVFEILARYEHKIDRCIARGEPEDAKDLLHPIYNAFGYEFVDGWGFRQNDAIGLTLYVSAMARKAGCPVVRNDRDLRITQKLVRYLEAIPYWKPENSVWEEAHVVSTPTIYSCIKGLEAIREYVDAPETLIQTGYEVGRSLANRHSDLYEVDASQLYLYFPLAVERDSAIIERIEQELRRSHGVIRHLGDYYQAGQDGQEAEWNWIFYWLGISHFHLGNREKAADYLRLGDSLRFPPDWSIPEAYIPLMGTDQQIVHVPSEHTPLAWGHAYAALLRYWLYLSK